MVEEDIRYYKKIKKHLRITDAEIALMFGYSSGHSFRNSARNRKVIHGVCRLYESFLKNNIGGGTQNNGYEPNTYPIAAPTLNSKK